jgi:hypothetical protein
MGGTEPCGPADLAAIWQQTLARLSLQMGRATFSTWLQATSLVAGGPEGLFVVETPSQPGQAWLDQRLRPVIEQTLAGVVKQQIELKFVVRGAESPLEAARPPEPQPAPLPPEARVDPPTADFIRRVDFEGLWQKTGFTAMPDYTLHYWRMYLGRAFDLWQLLVSKDKRDVKLMRQGELPYWTPPQRYSYRLLAHVLNCARMTLTGRFIPCAVYEREKSQAKARGEAINPAACCGRHPFCQVRLNQHQEPERIYWVEGLLERLYREGLVAVQQVIRLGKPRSYELRLQVWRLLPVLTPSQIAYFKYELDHVYHRQWLERYGHLCGFNLANWEQIQLETLVPYLPGYDRGRVLFDSYCNNPLAEITQSPLSAT